MIGVIGGPIYSGKTKELINQVNLFSRVKILLAPSKDKSGQGGVLKSHDETLSSPPCGFVSSIVDIIKQASSLPSGSLVAIDDGHQFPRDLLDVVLTWSLDRDLRVLVAGRDRDEQNLPNQTMLDLLGVCDQAVKLWGVCEVCKTPDAGHMIDLGEKGLVPICAKHFREKKQERGVDYFGRTPIFMNPPTIPAPPKEEKANAPISIMHKLRKSQQKAPDKDPA